MFVLPVIQQGNRELIFGENRAFNRLRHVSTKSAGLVGGKLEWHQVRRQEIVALVTVASNSR